MGFDGKKIDLNDVIQWDHLRFALQAQSEGERQQLKPTDSMQFLLSPLGQIQKEKLLSAVGVENFFFPIHR